MDSSTGDEPPPKKKPRSDSQRASAVGNFTKRHKKRRNKALARNSAGLQQKATSYDTKGAAAALGVAPNSQAITSALMPAAEPEPRKPTKEDCMATIKSQEREIVKLQSQATRVGQQKARVEAELKLKTDKVVKVRDDKKRQAKQFRAELKLKADQVAKLRADKKRQAKTIADLAARLREEKKAYRVAFGVMDHIETRAKEAEYEMKNLQSDLVAARELSARTLAQAEKDHKDELREAEQQHRKELKQKAQAERRFSCRKASEKLQKAREENRMVETNLNNLLDEHKARAKGVLKQSISDLESLSDKFSTTLVELEKTHVDQLDDVKKKSRDNLQRQRAASREKIKSLKARIDKLEQTNLELVDEGTKARRERRKAERKQERLAAIAASRLERMNDAKDKAEELAAENDALKEELEIHKEQVRDYEDVLKECARIKDSEGRGGLRWLRWMVLFVIEMLANGTAPSAIPENIRSAHWTLYGKAPTELPGVDFCRKCRTVMDRFNECMVGMLLARGKMKTCHTDGTNRRQTAFEAFVIGLEMENQDVLKNILVSSCIFMETEDADGCVDGLERKLEHIRHALKRVREVMSENGHSPDEYDVPKPEDIRMESLGENNGAIITDSCHHARKEQQVIEKKVGGTTHKIDCANHTRCVVVKNQMIALNEHTTELVKDSIDNIAPILRVTTSLDNVLIAFDKEFSLCANYPKGHGEKFLNWITSKYPDAMLFHVERSGGGRQDLALMASLPIYWNREWCVQFLDEQLRAPGNENILQKNLFTILTSSEMVAVTRLLAIYHIAIGMPLRYLTGKTHEWKEHDWGVVELGRAFDCWYNAMVHLKDNPGDYLDEEYMMSIFNDIKEDLPPFEDYLDHMFTEKKTTSIGGKEVLMSKLRDELFSPEQDANMSSTEHMSGLVKVIAEIGIKEMTDTNKAIHRYVSANGPELAIYSHKHASQERRIALRGVPATNDLAESSLGGATYQLQRFGRIGIKHAAAVSDVRRNGWLRRGTKEEKGKHKRPAGLFHTLPEPVQFAIMESAIKDAPQQRTRNTEELDLQRKAKEAKEKLIHELNLHNSTEAYIDAIYYYKMYFSEACMKDMTAGEVQKAIDLFPSKTAKLDALKENIRMRKLGLGFDWVDDKWSKSNKAFGVGVLTSRLIAIIQREGRDECIIPTTPPVKIASRSATVPLGTSTPDLEKLEEKYSDDAKQIRKTAMKLLKQRESEGKGSLAAECQPWQRPEVRELVTKRVEVYTAVDVGDGKECIWWPGRVMGVHKEDRQEVLIEWDPLEDVAGWEFGGRAVQKLKNSLWRKDKEGAWRMEYVDTGAGEDSDDDQDDENSV